MSYVSIDVESDGPIPHKYSMVSFGAVIVESSLSKTFYGKTKPISNLWIPEALAVSNHTREEHELFEDPKKVMEDFDTWLRSNCKGKPIFISDNPAFDFAFINYYFHTYLGDNPFGHSGRSIGDLYCGMKMDTFVNKKWKQLYRKTKHTHNPVDDSRGNAEALLAFKKLGLKISLK